MAISIPHGGTMCGAGRAAPAAPTLTIGEARVRYATHTKEWAARLIISMNAGAEPGVVERELTGRGLFRVEPA